MTPFFVLESFNSFLSSEKRYSLYTIEAYSNDLKQFFEFTEIDSVSNLNEINHHVVRSWIIFLNDQKINNKTINRKLASLRTFFKWAVKQKIVNQNPLNKIKGPKKSSKLTIFAKESELEKNKIDNLFTDDFGGIRDKLIFEMFYQTGIRLNELIKLKEENIGNNYIKVLGKRNKERIIPISENLTNLILEFKIHKNKLLHKTSSFFCLNSGKNLYPKFVYRKINTYLSRVTSLDVKSPHILRHTFATHMLNNGAGIETLKDLLGHSSLAATQIYTHNSFTQLNNIYSSAHPRGRSKN